MPLMIWQGRFHNTTPHLQHRCINSYDGLRLKIAILYFLVLSPNRSTILFLARIFTQIRPVWIGELETKPKTSKKFGWGIILGKTFFSVVTDSS
jgi:hypothetical protein